MRPDVADVAEERLLLTDGGASFVLVWTTLLGGRGRDGVPQTAPDRAQ